EHDAVVRVLRMRNANPRHSPGEGDGTCRTGDRVMSEPRLVEVRKNILKQNDLVARELRERFRAAGTFVVSLVSSPGSGKTALLERTLTALRAKYRVAALVGDL